MTLPAEVRAALVGAGVPWSAAFESRLPEAEDLPSLPDGEIRRDLGRQGIALLQATSTRIGATFGSRDLAALVAGASAPAGAFAGALVEAVEAKGAAKGAALVEAAQELTGALQAAGAFAKVPIVGWIVGAALAGAEIGLAVWARNHPGPLPPEADAIRYSRGADQQAAQAILEAMEAPDWRPIFLPRAAGPWVETKAKGFIYPDAAGPIAVNGRIWSRDGDPVGLGVTPTGAWFRRSQMREADFDAWRKHPVPWDAAKVFHEAIYRPSVRSLAMAAAQAVQAGRQRFAVAWPGVADAWDAYWRDAPFPAPPSLYASPGYAAQAGPTVRQACDALRAAQFAALDTLWAAYVSRSDPAFLGDPELAARLAERRTQLLRHPAVHRVRMADVPDAAYRLHLGQARLGFAAGGVPPGNAGGPQEPPAVPPPVVPPKAPPLPKGEGDAQAATAKAIGAALIFKFLVGL